MKGGYILFLELKEPKTLAIGRLGEHEFPAGLYAYAGSGLKNLEARVERHASPSKKRHWHIDYLTTEAEPLDFYAFESDHGIECELASSMEKYGGKHLVKGFGSSDCHCESHLLYLGGTKDQHSE